MFTGEGTLKKAPTGRTGMVALGRSPTIEGLIGVLLVQRVKHFGLTFAIDLRISDCGRF